MHLIVFATYHMPLFLLSLIIQTCIEFVCFDVLSALHIALASNPTALTWREGM